MCINREIAMFMMTTETEIAFMVATGKGATKCCWPYPCLCVAVGVF